MITFSPTPPIQSQPSTTNAQLCNGAAIDDSVTDQLIGNRRGWGTTGRRDRNQVMRGPAGRPFTASGSNFNPLNILFANHSTLNTNQHHDIGHVTAMEALSKQVLESLAGGESFEIKKDSPNRSARVQGDQAQQANPIPPLTNSGLCSQEITAFFRYLEQSEPSIAISGGHYWISESLEALNATLLTEALMHDPRYRALNDQPTQQSFLASLRYIYHSPVLRNRNPLHANKIDATIMSVLLGAVKHLFDLPYAAYATNGNDSLSSVLYDYKCHAPEKTEVVLLCEDDAAHSQCIQGCLGRLGFSTYQVESWGQLTQDLEHKHISLDTLNCVVTNTVLPAATELPEALKNARLPIHTHLSDRSFRQIIKKIGINGAIKLHPQCATLSTCTGLFKTAFSVFRHFKLRDHQISVPLQWKTVYLSQNEGGSSNLRPLLEDLVMLYHGQEGVNTLIERLPTDDEQAHWLQATPLGSGDPAKETNQAIGSLGQYNAAGRTEKQLMKSALKQALLRSTLTYVGGRQHPNLHGFVTGGGTRSITRALECVKHIASQFGCDEPHIIVGDPHFAVERNERKLGVVAQRLPQPDGTLCLRQLEEQISSPQVFAVFAQSLSYTSGLSDPIADIVERVEGENLTRSRLGLPLVTLIVDCCLSFSVLLHENSHHLFDYPGITPRIVTFDLHKHVGTDKGMSVTIGTPGTVDRLTAYPQVGAEPEYTDLYRAYTCMHTIGPEGYQRHYRSLKNEITLATGILASAGILLISSDRRPIGSTVIAAYDPFAAIAGCLERKHNMHVMPLYNLEGHCKTGWQLCVTLDHLKPSSDGRQSKLMAFAHVVVAEHQKLHQQRVFTMLRNQLASDNSIATALYGGLEPLIFSCLPKNSAPALIRHLSHAIVKRYMTTQLDRDLLEFGEPRNTE